VNCRKINNRNLQFNASYDAIIYKEQRRSAIQQDAFSVYRIKTQQADTKQLIAADIKQLIAAGNRQLIVADNRHDWQEKRISSCPNVHNYHN
jgi:hypothetical protein